MRMHSFSLMRRSKKEEKAWADFCPEALTCSCTWSHLTQPHPWNPKSYTHTANALVLFPHVGCTPALCWVGLCNGGSVRRKGRAAGQKSRERVTQLFTPAAEDQRDCEIHSERPTLRKRQPRHPGKVRNQGRPRPPGRTSVDSKAAHHVIDGGTERCVLPCLFLGHFLISYRSNYSLIKDILLVLSSHHLDANFLWYLTPWKPVCQPKSTKICNILNIPTFLYIFPIYLITVYTVHIPLTVYTVYC